MEEELNRGRKLSEKEVKQLWHTVDLRKNNRHIEFGRDSFTGKVWDFWSFSFLIMICYPQLKKSVGELVFGIVRCCNGVAEFSMPFLGIAPSSAGEHSKTRATFTKTHLVKKRLFIEGAETARHRKPPNTPSAATQSERSAWASARRR